MLVNSEFRFQPIGLKKYMLEGVGHLGYGKGFLNPATAQLLNEDNNIATSTCFLSHEYCQLIDEAKHCYVCEHIAGEYIHDLARSLI